MAWYYGTFSCGHEGRVNVVGPIKDRQWKIDRAFENMCEECYRKYLEEERNRANSEALKKAKEMELPELIGSEKQVAWANTLRNGFLEKLDNMIEDVKGEDEYDSIKRLRKLFKINKSEDKDIIVSKIIKNLYRFQDIFISNTKATYFINNRYENLGTLMKEELDNIINYEKNKEEAEIKNQIIKETTVEPNEVKFNGVVEIVVNEDNIKAIYEKNETFRLLVKDLGYKWENMCWQRKIKETTGSYIDRSAELCNKLLNAGFRVAIPEEEIKEKALNGTYEQECHRWIYKRKDTNKFAIWWNNHDNNLFKAAKHLKGARWDSPSILVHVENYEQVTEFAEMYGFKFTKAALELIEEYKNELSNIEKVSAVTVEKVQEKNGLEDILNSSREVLDDLKEED